MSRERKAELKPDKCDLWSYPQYYPVTFSGSEMKEINFINYNSSQGTGGGAAHGILSPLSLNADGRSPSIKHQPYLDGFADASILAAYGDGQQIALHGIVHEQHLQQSRLHEEDGNRVGFSSPRSSSGGESCSRESSTSSRRHRQESVGQRQERLRKNAERGKLRRLEETEDQRQRRLARNAERGKLRRMEESQDKRDDRLRKNAERQKARRNKESPEERQLRLWKNAERQRIRRSTSTTAIKVELSDCTVGYEHLL